MAYIYENDITKTSANLQKTVAYLVSLHKNEYEWNMLGIKVIGHIDALPIPDGDYEYGDCYMVGIETPYEMYIYTRADALHTEDYWFNVGQFPQPGPQGPAGPSLIDVNDMSINQVGSVQYDNDQHMTVEYLDSKLKYVDPNSHEVKEDTIDNVTLKLPLEAGKYISMDATPDNNALEIKVDDTALAADYYKIDKSSVTQITVPVNNKGTVGKIVATQNGYTHSIVLRDDLGGASFYNIRTAYVCDLSDSQAISFTKLWNTCGRDAIPITKTVTDTGTFNSSELLAIKLDNAYKIQYNNQIYYRMDPVNAPDGTMTFIHIDTVQNGSGGYKATGKCFSITVSTRAWQVVDIDFGSGGSGSTEYAFTHHIHFVTTDNKVYAFDISTHDNTAISFDDLMANYDGLVIHGVQAPETASTVFTPAIYRVVSADEDIELLSADMSVLSSIKKDNISQEEDYVTESQPN